MFVSLLVAALVISSSLILSSAQLSGSSQECVITYNALFTSTSESVEACANAYYANAEYRNASDHQKMLVCDADQSCNDMIENVIDVCGDTVSCLAYARKPMCISEFAHAHTLVLLPCMALSINTG